MMNLNFWLFVGFIWLLFFISYGSCQEVTVIYVSAEGQGSTNCTGQGSFNNPSNSIQCAIDMIPMNSSSSNYIISAFPGRYTGPGNTQVNLENRFLTIQSMNSSLETIIDCNGENIGWSFNNDSSIMKNLTINQCRFSIYNGTINVFHIQN
jgi:pectin methylesterase-like acyl-CoA thioesterase